MPELPEVQTTVNDLGDLKGIRLTGFDFLWPRQIEPDPDSFSHQFTGATITATGRRGKYVCLYTDAGTIAIHLRMSGKLAVLAGEAENTKHTRAVIHLGDGRKICFDDARKFGRFKAIPMGDDIPGVGIEPLEKECTAAFIFKGCQRVRKPIKTYLLDQSFVCGLGNIYTDEVCFAAGIMPTKLAKDLSFEECESLQKVMVAILSKAIELRGTSFDWAYDKGSMQDHIKVYGRSGEPCFNCGTTLESIIIGGRRSVFCPHCQK